MKFILAILIISAISGCNRETQAERDAATHRVCKDAGLETKQGASITGTLVLYCAPPEVKP